MVCFQLVVKSVLYRNSSAGFNFLTLSLVGFMTKTGDSLYLSRLMKSHLKNEHTNYNSISNIAMSGD